MFGGQMACEATNWMLKRLIKEERPHSKRDDISASHTLAVY